MTSNGIISAIVASSGFTAIILAVVNALFNRKRTKAEASAVISQAAGGLVENLVADNTRLRAENAVYETRMEKADRLERKRQRQGAELRTAIEAHNAWDQYIVEVLTRLGVTDVKPPPALPVVDWDD